jgi:transcriptional regulator with XRE-family HTH domain
MDGSTQPTADILYKIAKYFDVSVDYLLTGISSSNTEIHKQLGLSEKAINFIKRAKETDKFYNCADIN